MSASEWQSRRTGSIIKVIDRRPRGDASSHTLQVKQLANVVAGSGDASSFTAYSGGTAYSAGTAANPVVSFPQILSLSPSSISHPEGNSGTRTYTYTVTRTGSLACSVNWAVTGSGTVPAVASDFFGGVLPRGVATFGIGDSTRSIVISVVGNTGIEGTKQFTITLSNPVNTTIGTATARGIIVNDDFPVLNLSPSAISQSEGNSGTTLYTYTVTRTGTLACSVNWAVTGSGASPAVASDFSGGVLPSGVATFGIGDSTRSIVISVVGDTTVEATKQFTVTLSSPTSATIGTSTATGTIVNDDVPVLDLSPLTISQSEGSSGITTYTYTVTRTGTMACSVNWAVTGSGTVPAVASDFSGNALPGGTATFALGDTTKSIVISVVGDTTVEATKQFTVTLSSPTSATIGVGTATGIIVNDDFPVLNLSPSAISQSEGNSGTTSYTYTVTRTGTLACSVNWAVTGSGASPAVASDFSGNALPGGVLAFANGDVTRTIVIDVVGDTTVEATKQFTVTLSNPTSATIGTATATGTIVNDDFPGLSISPSTISQAEGSTGTTSYTYTVARSGTLPCSVSWAVTGSGTVPAVASDFSGGSLPGGVVIFELGDLTRSIVIDVIGDASIEGTKQFTVTLSNPINSTISVGTATGIIVNDDFPVLSLSPSTLSQTEGNSGTSTYTYTVTRTGTLACSVNWAVTGSGASPAVESDFSGGILPSGTATFALGDTTKSIVISVVGDTTVEPTKEFTVTLSDPVDATIGIATATGTIVNNDFPVLSLTTSTISQAEGSSGTTTYTYTVTRTGTLACSVNWAVTGTGASPAVAADFSGNALPGGVLNFEVGDDTKSIVIDVVGDTDIEATKQFTVTLSSPTSATIGTATATGTITNDDFPVLDLSPSTISQSEGNSGTTLYTYTVTRTGTLACSVNWAVTGSGDSPAVASDFSGGTLPSGTATFALGDTTKSIVISVVGDTGIEATKEFTVTLSSPTSATIGTATATGTIVNDDFPVLSLTTTTISQPEGNSGTTTYTYTVTRTGTMACSVNWAVTGSSAAPAVASDFSVGVLPSGVLNFEVGDDTKSIVIDVVGDTDIEATKQFTVTLSNPTSATIGTATATGTITNDDFPVLDLSPLTISQTEGNSGTTLYTYTVTRTGTLACSVNWAVTGSGTVPAVASDFSGGTLPSGTATFALGDTTKSIVISVVGDATVEATKEFTVTLSSPSSATIGVGTATGTIVNDDFPVLSLSPSTLSQSEGDSGTRTYTYTITRTGTLACSVNWAVTGSGAVPAVASDFAGGVLPQGVAPFGVGNATRTIVISVVGDATVEATKQFTVTLSNPTSATIGVGTATGTIVNDDFPVLSLTTSTISQSEGNSGTTLYTYTVTRTGTLACSVNWAVTGSGTVPAVASDFSGGTLPSGTASFATGDTTKSIIISVAGDTSMEATKEFTVTLSSPTSATIGVGTATGTIVNDDLPVLSLSPSSTIQTEGNSGSKTYTYTINSTGTLACSVNWAVTGTGASPAVASDFSGGTLPSGVATFASGDSTKSIVVNVAGDTTVESTKEFTITLSSPTSATIGTATATGTIVNDDFPVLSLSPSNISHPEGNAGSRTYTYTVTRTGTMACSVSWAVTGTSAAPAIASDFSGGTLPSGVATFAIGDDTKTIVISVAGDITVEATKEFTVTLSNPVDATIGTATATGTIFNDDA